MAAKSNVFIHVHLESDAFPSESARVRELVGTEGISRLFRFDVDFIILDQPDLDPQSVIGAAVSLVFTLEPEGTVVRRIQTMAAAIEAVFEMQVPHRAYRLTLVPHAYRFSLVEMQEVFMDMSVPEIITQKASDAGVPIEMRLLGTYPKLPFVVQYKETDFNFVSRLAEHYGISFCFEHTGDVDTIVFTDSTAGFLPIEGGDRVTFRPRGEASDVYRFEGRTQLVPQHFMQSEYNYETPMLPMGARYVAPTGDAGGMIEYGANYKTPDEGLAFACIRAQERECTKAVYKGLSEVCRLSAGATFSLEEQPAAPARMLLIEVEHRASQAVMLEGGTQEGRTYSYVFHAIDAALTYRPPRRAQKPRIHGLIPGLIEPLPGGGIGQYAQIDTEGRYTVRLFFDLSPPKVLSSLPVRMLQPHAGPNYGMHFPLKPGTEVMVAFVEGDPDRPVIVGAAPNPIMHSPVTQTNAIMNRIETASGVFLEIRDI
jgi:type VI secretion system secreted protein VgrG